MNRETPVNMGAAWNALFALKSKRDMPGGPCAIFAADKEWYGAAAYVDDKATIEAPLEEIRVPAGKWLIYRYIGAYDGLTDAWKGFTSSVGDNTVDARRPFIESYRDDGSGSADGKPITDLSIPVS